MNRKPIIMLFAAAAIVLIAVFIRLEITGRTVDLNKAVNGSETALKVRRGTLLQYSYRLHESVGYTAEYTITQPKLKVLALKTNKTSYLRPWRMLPGMTGGDEARGTFVFQARTPGTVILTVHELFRGEVESTDRFKITVR